MPRMPRYILPVLAFTMLTLLLVWALLLRWIDSQPAGTGESVPAPDGLHSASVMSYTEKDFWTGEIRNWFEFRVSGPGQDKLLTTSPIPGPYFGSRSSHRVAYWDADSTAVQFVFPTFTLRIETRPDAP